VNEEEDSHQLSTSADSASNAKVICTAAVMEERSDSGRRHLRKEWREGCDRGQKLKKHTLVLNCYLFYFATTEMAIANISRLKISY